MSSNSIRDIYYSCNDRVYTIALKVVLGIVAIHLSLETRLRAVFVFHKQNINDAPLTLQRKEISIYS